MKSHCFFLKVKNRMNVIRYLNNYQKLYVMPLFTLIKYLILL